jgi:hypothetical protein
MRPPYFVWHGHVKLIGAPALACAMASAGLAENGMQWRLHANVPLRCAIIDVSTPADRPQSIEITTTCNAQAYKLVLHPRAGQPDLLSAQSSAGPAQISGSVVTITSMRPGAASTMIDLDAPVVAGQFTVTLEPA